MRAMLTPHSRELLKSVYDDLSQPISYPGTVSDAEQAAWIDRQEAESALAGLISTALAGGRVDVQALRETRACVERSGARSDAGRVAAVLRVPSQAT
jgi:hypothetical protein